jgi:hypothetical protein
MGTIGNFCTSCGTQNPPGSKFCGNCGVAVKCESPDTSVPPLLSPSSSLAQTVRPKSLVYAQWALLALLVVTIVCVLTNSDNDRVNPTVSSPKNEKKSDHAKSVVAYRAARKICDLSVGPPDILLVEQKRFDEYALMLDRYVQHYRRIADNLRRLDLSGVDSEVASFLLDTAEVFDLCVKTGESRSQVFTFARNYADQFDSPAAILEAIVRGAAGDPFGKSVEAFAAQSKFRDLQNEEDSAMQRMKDGLDRLDQQDSRIRLFLRTKYGADL